MSELNLPTPPAGNVWRITHREVQEYGEFFDAVVIQLGKVVTETKVVGLLNRRREYVDKFVEITPQGEVFLDGIWSFPDRGEPLNKRIEQEAEAMLVRYRQTQKARRDKSEADRYEGDYP